MGRSFSIAHHHKVSEQSLVRAMQIEQAVKPPRFIPLYECMTLPQIAEYFGLPEKRVRNAYKTNYGLFELERDDVSGRELSMIATERKDYGPSYGYALTFANGVKAQVAYSGNVILNSRALLHMALILADESKTAMGIAKIIANMISGDFKWCDLPKYMTPWYRIEEPQPSCPACEPQVFNLQIQVSQTPAGCKVSVS